MGNTMLGGWRLDLQTAEASRAVPWPRRSLVSIREELILKVLAKEDSVVELAQQYGVSRKTIYKWLSRYESKGLSGLVDESRRPKRSPMKTSAELALEIVQLRKEHPRWASAWPRCQPRMSRQVCAGPSRTGSDNELTCLVIHCGTNLGSRHRARCPRFCGNVWRVKPRGDRLAARVSEACGRISCVPHSASATHV
jgi:transposase-like protein